MIKCKTTTKSSQRLAKICDVITVIPESRHTTIAPLSEINQKLK